MAAHSQNVNNLYHFVQSVVDDFWKRWTELYTTPLAVQPAEMAQFAPMRCSDCYRQQHSKRRLSVVKEVFPGEDGKMYRGTVQYKSYRTGESLNEC